MAPWKCPDCGVWWAGLEHRCAPVQTGTRPPTRPFTITTDSFTVRCTCPPDRGDNYHGTCLLHDVMVVSLHG